MHITFDHVTFTYQARTLTGQKALKDISLEFDTGQIIGICGMTGSGKSTFVRHVNGILKPNSGRILIDGEDIHASKESLRRIRQRVGMTFQFPERQLFGRTVWEELTYTPEKHRIPENEIVRRIEAVSDLLKFDIRTLRDRSPFSLSRGEQRKLGIAVILTLQPELLVLDEPTAGMDRANAYQFFDVLRTLHHKKRHQVIFVSHDIELLLKYAEYLIILNAGEILLTDTAQQVINASDRLEAFGISLPPVHRTLHLLHKKYPQLNTGITSLEEAVEEVLRYILIG